MSMFSIFGVSGSAVSAESQRLNVVASNLANADAVAGPDGQGYKARQVVFETVPFGSDESAGVKVRPNRRVAVSKAASTILSSWKYGLISDSSRSYCALRSFSA